MSVALKEIIELEVLRHLDAGVCVVDPEDRIVGWSDRLERRGMPGAQWEGRSAQELLRALCPKGCECMGRVTDAIHRARTRGEATNFGEEVPVELPDPVLREHRLVVAPLGVQGESPRRVALLFMPFHAGRQVREHFERILDSTPDGIMVIDPQKRLRVFNRACGELLGRDPEEVLRDQHICGEVVNCHTEQGESLVESSLCPAVDLFAGRTSHQVSEMLTTNAQGQERWIETSYSAVEGRDGRVEFVIGILRDVHERKMLEARLHQTEKLAALGQLTAGIAHEIKNPLGIILSSVEIILDENRPHEMRSEAASFIKDEVKRLDDRIRSFLAFARPAPPNPEPIVINGQIRRIAPAIRSNWRDLTLHLELEPLEAIVQLDPDQLSQVLTNLLINAADAVEGRGVVLVKTRICGEKVCVEVHDDGPGIPEDLAARIFDPFFTTKSHGTGLGLSIVHQLVTANGGSIRCGRSPLGGAAFHLSLPFRCASE